MNQANISDGEAGSSVRSKLNIMKDNIISSAHLGKVRCVYLVQDAADLTHLNGAGNAIYQSAQDAYNAANALQIALGGTNKVIIFVGNTTAATVGDITLSANWNYNVEVVGIASNVSQIGNIIATNASGSGFRVGFTVISQYARFNSVKIGNITTNATGTTGSSGTVGLMLNNAEAGNIDTSITNASNTTGNGGTVQIGTSTFASFYTIGNITTTSKGSSTTSGSVTMITAGSFRCGSITTANSTSGGAIVITPQGSGSITSITSINSTANQGAVTLSNVSITGALTVTNDVTVQIKNSSVTGIFTYLALSPGDAEARIDKSILGVITLSSDYKVKVISNNSLIGSINYLGNDSFISETIFDTLNGTANNNINEFGTNCKIMNSSLRTFDPNFSIKSTSDGIIEVGNTQLNSSISGCTVKKLNGILALTDNAGVFDFDGSVTETGVVTLNGSNAGANTLNLGKLTVGKTYKFVIINATGTDTLAISNVLGNLIQGGSYTPTASAGALDILTVLVEENGASYVSITYNFS